MTENVPEKSYRGLRESLARGEVAAFVGAGLSIGAGLPGWFSLVNGLAARIGFEMPPKEWVTAEILMDAAQDYIHQEGLNSLVIYLKNQLDTTGRSPTAAHQALVRLPVSMVFTANYDNLLERAYQDAGIRTQVVVRDDSIPFMRRDPGSVNIIKLYGDLAQEDTLVLARQQYETFFLQRQEMLKLLDTELARANMLYLGWSHTDPHFNLLFGELLSRFGQNLRAGYAVMFDIKPAQQRELVRKQIHLVQLSSQGDLNANVAAWLESLMPAGLR